MAEDMLADYQRVADGAVSCVLCPHHCRLGEGCFGRCRVRCVRQGRLRALSYGRLSSLRIDPVEKKPLYHYYPGSMILSVGGWGCNFRCDFCQNWQISQSLDEQGQRALPEAVMEAVRRARVNLVAYTYNEPLVNFEFVRDCSKLLREAGIGNVLVTNGFVEKLPAEELLNLTDALNLDIKSMDDDFYRCRCKGSLEPVLRFARLARDAGCHIEITHLLVPGKTPVAASIGRLASWVADHLGAETPLHISAYHPCYRSQTPSTSPDQLIEAHAVASGSLSFVYLGNVVTDKGRDTFCPGCGRLLVRRGKGGYGEVSVAGISAGCCQDCGFNLGLRVGKER